MIVDHIISFLIVAMHCVAGYVLGERLKVPPDDFAKDGYIWSINQTGHVVLGLVYIIDYMLLGWLIVGELPDKFTALAGLGVGYAMFEARQRGTKIDQLQDWLFVMYGACAAILAGNYTYGDHPDESLVVVGCVVLIGKIHMLGGYLWRKNSLK